MTAIVFRLLSTFLMIAVGYIARKRGLITNDTTRQLSRLLTAFFYPPLIFHSMTRNFDGRGLIQNWPLPLGAFSIMLAGFCLGLFIERFVLKPSPGREHAFLFQCTINNFSFLPLPLALMLWGEIGVAGIIFSSLGSELALWTLGLFSISGRKVDAQSFKRMISPPLVTIAVALLWILLRDSAPPALLAPLDTPAMQSIGASLLDALRMLGAATIPVAMVVAGSRMASLRVNHIISLEKAVVSILRLLVIPALTVLALHLIPVAPDIRRTLILVATMPSAVSSVIFAELYGEDAEFAAACVLLTHILCLLTIPIWLHFAL